MIPDKGSRLSINPSNFIDRRSQSTRDAIGRAFLKLGGMRDFDRLKVGELVREAGVARSTFYAHYRGLDDYLARSFAAMLAGFARREQSAAILPVRDIMAHVAAAGESAGRLAADRRFPMMMIEGERALRRVASERLAACRPSLGEIERRTLATVITAGFLSMLRDWMEQGRVISADQLAQRFEAVEAKLFGA